MKNKIPIRIASLIMTLFMLSTSTSFASSVNIGSLQSTNSYTDGNGYITSTYGYTLKGDSYVDETEIWSHTGGAIYDLNAGTPGSREKIVAAGVDTFYNMSDEIFFGKWDSANEIWAIEGKIDYDKYPGLATAMESVKIGDYEGAKEAYLNYYIERERIANRQKYTITAESDRIMADLLLKNYMYNHVSGMTPLGLLYPGQAITWHTLDVQSTVQSYKGRRQNLSFLITATDKDGGVAEFYSSESEYAPRLRLTVNGEEKVVSASEDTYIRAGYMKGSSFGSEKKLYAAESATADSYYLVDSNSMRSYVKFDVSFLKSGDTVSSAALELYGYNSKNNGKKKEVVVFYTDDSGWNESSTWKSLPSTIFSYDQLDSWSWIGPGTRQSDWGSRYMEELLRFSGWYNNLIGMYNTTGDEKYAYTVLRIMMDYINVTKHYTRYMKDLDIGCRAGNLPVYLMQILESEHMTPDIFTGIMKYIWIQGNELMQFFSSDFNWGVMERNGHYTIALFCQEFKDSSKWFGDVRGKFEEVVANTLNDDGSCSELALGYVWTTVTNPLSALGAAEKYKFSGAPEPLSDKCIDDCNSLMRYMMAISMPGYRDHQEGDSNSHTAAMTSKFRTMYDISGDEVLLYGASNGKEGTAPDFTSIAYRGTGKKIAMRSGWESDANYMYASVDGNQGVHGHEDDCNLMVSAYGQYLLVDPLYGTYSGTNASYWLKSSEAHNVVTVNGNSHATGSGTEIADWETNDVYDFASLRTSNATGADNYTRSILFVKPGFWLVNDYLEPTDKENENTYSQTWHFLPQAEPEMDSDSKAVTTNFDTANIKVVPVNCEKLSLAELKDGWYSSGMGSVQAAKYTAYEKKVTGNAVFNTILYPQKNGKECEITTEPIVISDLDETEASAYNLHITEIDTEDTSHYQYYQLHDMSKKELRTIGSFLTDASLLLAEMSSSGDMITLVARNASYIKNIQTGEILWESDEEEKEISVKYKHSRTISRNFEGVTLEELGDQVSFSDTTANPGSMGPLTGTIAWKGLALNKNSAGTGYGSDLTGKIYLRDYTEEYSDSSRMEIFSQGYKGKLKIDINFHLSAIRPAWIELYGKNSQRDDIRLVRVRTDNGNIRIDGGNTLKQTSSLNHTLSFELNTKENSSLRVTLAEASDNPQLVTTTDLGDDFAVTHIRYGFYNYGAHGYVSISSYNVTRFDTEANEDEVLESVLNELDYDKLEINPENVTGDVTFPSEVAGRSVKWSSSDSGVMTNDGKITRTEDSPSDVIVTAKLNLNGYEVIKRFYLTVSPVYEELIYSCELAGVSLDELGDQVSFSDTTANPGSMGPLTGTVAWKGLAVNKVSTGTGYGSDLYGYLYFRRPIEEYSESTRAESYQQSFKGKLKIDVNFHLSAIRPAWIELHGSNSASDDISLIRVRTDNGNIRIDGGSLLKQTSTLNHKLTFEIDTTVNSSLKVTLGEAPDNTLTKETTALGEDFEITGIRYGFYNYGAHGYIAIRSYSITRIETSTPEEGVLDVTLPNLTLKSICNDPRWITSDITLPSEINGCAISWSSSDTGVISNSGSIIRPEADTDVFLTAKVSLNGYERIKKFKLTAVAPGNIYFTDKIFDTDLKSGGFRILNDTTEDKGGIAMIAIYDSDGELADVISSDVPELAPGESFSFSNSYTSTDAIDYIKFLFWDKSNLKPHTKSQIIEL